MENVKHDALFRPGSVAIIGASRTPGKVGYILTENVIESGFQGHIYPINPNAEEIQGLKCFSSILDVPEEVDLAVIAIPARHVPQVAEECGKKSVKALVVVSAGFKEIGREGAVLEAGLVEIGRKYGMRIQGPNCLGLIDTSTPLNLTFATAMPEKGRIGFISQSGALGTAVLDWVLAEDIGFHSFVSLGNKADLDEVDFIDALGEEDEVAVILLYLESIERGRRFIEVASRVVERKPVIILKGGTSSAGARAAGSHTGALVGSFLAYKTAFDKAGVILAESVEELFNHAITFTRQPVPMAEGIAIVTNAGGPGILATDLSEKMGLRLAGLSGETQNQLRQGLPAAAATSNPVDVLGDARADRYSFAMEKVLRDSHVNVVVVILTPQAMTESMATAEGLVELHGRFRGKPIVAVFMGGEEVGEASGHLTRHGIPCYAFPEKAIKTISALYDYARFLKEPENPPVRFRDVRPDRVREILDRVREDRRVVLLSHEAEAVVEAYGISVPDSRVAQSADAASRYAEELGFPVVLRIVSPDVLHKTDVGGVVLNLRSAEEVRNAFNGILASIARFMPRARIYGVMVYHMAPRGREMIIGMSQDVQFGPLVMFGLGGIYVNFLKDVSFRLAPLSEPEAREMMEETKAYALLKGIRGEPPSDTEALKNTILRVGQLFWYFPEIGDMDINHVIVYGWGEGCIALDVKMTLTKD
ncbi:MAG: acetate--CoA ligase family protein [Candidatus Bathyarchaeota archaeon]|nr:MAG: acetate--CoA ligase family protein [Candidatus Bathyarchaeota archaeon]